MSDDRTVVLAGLGAAALGAIALATVFLLRTPAENAPAAAVAPPVAAEPVPAASPKPVPPAKNPDLPPPQKKDPARDARFEEDHAAAKRLADQGSFREAIFELKALLESWPEHKDALAADLREVAALAEAALDQAMERAKADPAGARGLLAPLTLKAPDDIAKRAAEALQNIEDAAARESAAKKKIEAAALAAAGKFREAAERLEEAARALPDPEAAEKAALWRRLALYEGAIDPATLANIEPKTFAKIESAVEEYLSSDVADTRNEIHRRLQAIPEATPDLVAAVILRGGPFETQKSGDVVFEYLLPAGEKRQLLVSIPDGYAPDRLWPVFVHLHGTYGTLDMCRATAPSLRSFANGRFLVAQPVSAAHSGWGPMKIGEQQTPASLTFLRSKFPIDPDRVWLGGISMGSHGAWHQAMRHGDLYAAYVPVSGTPYGAYGLNWEAYLDNLRLAPARSIHGALDRLFPVDTPRKFAEKVNSLKLNVDYHEYAKSGHEGAPPGEIRTAWEWMIEQTRFPYPTAFSWTADHLDFARCSWVEATRLSEKGGKQRVQYVDQEKKPVETRMILSKPAKFTVMVKGQTVEIETREIERIRIWWTPRVFDLSKEVSIRVNGRQKWKGVPAVSIRAMLDEARRTGRRDIALSGSTEVDCSP